MGLGSWISHAFGSDQEAAQVPQAQFGRGQADAQMGRLQGMGAGFAGRGPIEANATDQANDYANQQQSRAQLEAAAMGKVPSVAEGQMQAGTDASVRAMMAAGSGARGGGLAQSLAGLTAINNGAQAQQQNVQNTAIQRANEQATARGQLANMDTSMRGQSQSWANSQADRNLAGRTANDQAQLSAEQLGQGYNAQAVQGDIAHMSAQAKANSENASNNQANSAGVIGAAGGLAKAYMTSDWDAKRGQHDLSAGHYDARPRPTLAHTITISEPHGPTVQIHRHGGPHQGMRFGGKSPGRPGVDAPWDDREYDVASGHSWHGDAQVEPIAPPPAWWGTHRTPATLAQRMTDHESAQMIGQGPTHMEAEWREANATPGSGRYRDMGPTESRLSEIAKHRQQMADDAEAERLAVDKRIGSPKVVSDDNAKTDVVNEDPSSNEGTGKHGGMADSTVGKGGQGDSSGSTTGAKAGDNFMISDGGAKVGAAIGGAMEEFGRIAGKQGPGKDDAFKVPTEAELGVKKKATPEGGESHVMKPGAKPGDAMILGDVTAPSTGAAEGDAGEAGLGSDHAGEPAIGAGPTPGGPNSDGKEKKGITYRGLRGALDKHAVAGRIPS